MRNVIFDLGGVVLEWNPDRILESYYTDSQVRGVMKSALFQHADWLQLDKGELTEPEALIRLQSRTGRPATELAGLFDAVRSSLGPKVETVALLETLARRGVPLYCLSNISSKNFDYLRERHTFWPLFKGVVISGDIRMMKPDAEIFEHLLERFGLRATQTVFVDDHAPNVDAARALGMYAVLFKDARQCEEELEPLLDSRG